MKLASNLELNGNNIINGGTLIVPVVELEETLALVSDLDSLATKLELEDTELVVSEAINALDTTKLDASTAAATYATIQTVTDNELITSTALNNLNDSKADKATTLAGYGITNGKTIQTAVSDPTASGNATAFIDSISQNTNGEITVTKKNINLSGYKTVQAAVTDPTASGNATSFIDTISQNTNGVITATKKSIDLSSYLTSAAAASTYATITDLQNDELVLAQAINAKLDKLTAGDGITIDLNNKISSVGYFYDYGIQSFREGDGLIAEIENATYSKRNANILECTGTPSITLKANDVIYYISDGEKSYLTVASAIGNEVETKESLTSLTILDEHFYIDYSRANGQYSHVEGFATVALNTSEHVEGQFNYPVPNAISSVGIGASESARTNAVVVLNNGDIYIKGLGTYLGQGITSATTLLSFLNTLSATVAELNALHPIYTISVSSAASGYEGALVDSMHETITSGRYTLKIVGYLAIGPDHEDPSDTGNYTVTYEINDDAAQSVEVSSHFGTIVFPMPYKNTTITILSVTPIS